MTSTEFAARYRLLKNVATRGARSFLAQQVELGRMVMVHYLDSENAEQRSATLARLNALQPPVRQKLLEIADVDGTPVVVTLFISSFVDFTMWLDTVSPGVAPPPLAPPVITPVPSVPVESPPSDFTGAFGRKVESAFSTMPPKTVPSRREDPPARGPAAGGEFTRIFGKVDDAFAGGSLSDSETPSAPLLDSLNAQDDSETEPTMIMEPVSPPKPNESVRVEPASSETLPPPSFGAASAPFTARAPAPAPAPAPAAADEGASFTAVFGALSPVAAGRSDLPPSMPAIDPPAFSERVMPPIAPVPEAEPASAPAPPPTPAPGEFTQLFQRLSPTQPAGGGMPAFPPTDSGRPFESVPAADFQAPKIPSMGAPAGPPVPAFGPPPAMLNPSSASLPNVALSGGGTPPRPPAPPNVSFAGGLPLSAGAPNPAPPTPGWGSPPSAPGSPVMGGGSSAPSEFTRILGRVSFPNPTSAPTTPAPPAAAAPAPDSSAPAEERPAAKSMMPLIVALNVVVLLTITIVAYFVLRK